MRPIDRPAGKRGAIGAFARPHRAHRALERDGAARAGNETLSQGFDGERRRHLVTDPPAAGQKRARARIKERARQP